MRILVTGATGYIGGAVVDALKRAGHQVVGLARSDEARSKLTAKGVQAVQGDLKDPAGLAAAVKDVDAVLWTATSNDKDVDAPAVAAVLGALQGTNKTFLYTSGVWVHGHTQGVANEEAPLNSTPIVAWRPAVEQRALNTPGVRGIVIRPGVVYGNGTGIPAMLTGSVKDSGSVTYVGTGENHWAVVFVDDLADLYVRALEKAPAGTVLLATQGPGVKVKDAAQAASEGAGVAGKTTAWPLEEARKQFGPFADALALDQRFTSEKAEKLLGWAPKGPSLLEELRSGSYARR
ncbi:NAD-dependent epimerase/dehydratase family protein [Corallococcus carmarthensis]|uniref:NAD-dependent epimerase/dehydratase family protein n=1 Tax=Corallococcus carmarthensis TaxID=2316728 RepID=UPI00148E350D|nr:NAD-dependent epimerase/dehydratase family protein [Corallococcus carmarthensis]NOK20133.1 NAD-dependent epimerase/dehydratase family protein [Corallococcus carmarthensis]